MEKSMKLKERTKYNIPKQSKLQEMHIVLAIYVYKREIQDFPWIFTHCHKIRFVADCLVKFYLFIHILFFVLDEAKASTTNANLVVFWSRDVQL